MGLTKIKKIVSDLEKMGIDPEIKMYGKFNDELKPYSFNTELKVSKDIRRDYVISPKSPGDNGSGFSFISQEDAFLKSLFEAVERFCNKTYKKGSLQHFQFNPKRVDLLDISRFSKSNDFLKLLGWCRGMDLLENKECFLPAQLVYLGYRLKKNELKLDYPQISTGAAAGSTRNQAILNGIYEVIERDAFMSTYLNVITPKLIDVKTIKDKILNSIIEKCDRYKLELYLLDITTDIKIPTYLSVIIDRTGLGPAVAVGAKSNLIATSAIFGAITESFMMRVSSRVRLRNGELFGEKRSDKFDVFSERLKLWFLPNAISNIEFMISGEKTSFKKNKDFKGNMAQELKLVLKTLKEMGLGVFCVDLSIKDLNKIGIYVYKIVIPGLQPLYLYENQKEKCIDFKRLKKVADYFGLKKQVINPLPHPFT